MHELILVWPRQTIVLPVVVTLIHHNMLELEFTWDRTRGSSRVVEYARGAIAGRWAQQIVWLGAVPHGLCEEVRVSLLL